MPDQAPGPDVADRAVCGGEALVLQFLRWDTAPGLGAPGEAEEGAPTGCVRGGRRPGRFVGRRPAGGVRAARVASVAERRPAVVVCRVHPTTWTESGAWWQVGVPSLSGHAEPEAHQARQLRWLSR